MDESRSTKPWRILCEVYAKLLAMLVQHWVFLVSCWAYPNRSLVKAAQTVQKHALHLASAFGSLRRLITALMTVQRCVAAGCRMNRRKKYPNTYQFLLDGMSMTTALADVYGAVGATALAIGRHKAALGFLEAVALGVLCNALVCLAVWLAMGGRTVTDKVLAVVFPMTAFVTMGLEHAIANMFFLPYAWVLGGIHDPQFVAGVLRNFGAVTLGNLGGGTRLVAGVYWLASLRPSGRTPGMGEEPPHAP